MPAGGPSPRVHPSLHAWMEAYIDGDEHAFNRLHGWLEPRIRGFLRKQVPDPERCDDIVQLTFLKAHGARDRFAVPSLADGRRPSATEADRAVAAWYFAIARNVAMDALRQQYRTEHRQVRHDPDGEISLEDFKDATPNAEERTMEEEEERAIRDAVSAAVAQLPTTQREVIELHKLRGLSMAEVAQRLELREGAVRVRAHRGYRTLVRLLGKHGRPSGPTS